MEKWLVSMDTMARRHSIANDDWSIEAVFPPPDFQTHQEGAEYAKELYSKAIVEP